MKAMMATVTCSFASRLFIVPHDWKMHAVGEIAVTETVRLRACKQPVHASCASRNRVHFAHCCVCRQDRMKCWSAGEMGMDWLCMPMAAQGELVSCGGCWLLVHGTCMPERCVRPRQTVGGLLTWAALLACWRAVAVLGGAWAAHRAMHACACVHAGAALACGLNSAMTGVRKASRRGVKFGSCMQTLGIHGCRTSYENITDGAKKARTGHSSCIQALMW